MTSRHALQWKTFPRRTKSAFSPETIERLSTKYGFSVDDLQALGMDVLTAITSPAKRTDERLLKRQRKKAEIRRDRARGNIAKAQDALAAAGLEISALTAEDAHVLGAFDRSPANWQRRLNESCIALERLKQDLGFSAVLDHALADPSEHDKRLERDDVRISVMNRVFLFWQKQGLKLSLTTRPDRVRETITGDLLDFARDVVADLTTQANILSADTLKADLKRARGQLEDFVDAAPFLPPNPL
jgi:hypothetical protein